MAFADNLKALPCVAHLAAIELSNIADEFIARIENKPGQAGSLAVYAALAQKHGDITPAVARQGLELYAEHTSDARANPGKHPNIDRLLQLLDTGETLKVRSELAPM
jgi:hypothetical protein